MPSRKRKDPNRQNLEDIAEGLTREVLQLPKQQTAEERAAAKRTNLGDVDKFIDDVNKVPETGPERVRRVAAKAERYEAYVEEVSPELSDRNASAEWMPRLLKRWIYDEVLTSPERTRPNSVNMTNSKGQQRSTLYMAASTLAQYQSAACMLLVCYMFPWPSMEELVSLVYDLHRFCHALVKYFDLARPLHIQNIMYSEEIRLLIEWVLGENFIGACAADVQTATLLLVYLYTGCRTGSLLSIASAVDNFLRWRDVELAPDRDKDGLIIGVKINLTLRHWKGAQFLSSFIIRYFISGTLKRKNLIFDLPCYLFAHAFRLGYLDGPEDLESYFAPTYTASKYPIKAQFLERPVFCRGRPKGLDVDKTSPLSSDGAYRVLRKSITGAGLRLENDPTISIYAARKGFLTQCYMNPNIGPEMTRILAGHSLGTWTLEKHYIKLIQDYNFVNVIGIGEQADGPDPLFLRRTDVTRARTIRQLVEIDMRLSEYTYAELVLRTSVMRSSDEWKTDHPFVLRPDTFKDYGMPELIDLWQWYQGLVRKRLQHLRVLEANGQLPDSTKQQDVDYQTRARRIAENAGESNVTRDIELKVMEEALKARDEGDTTAVESDPTTHQTNFDETALDGEDGENDAEDVRYDQVLPTVPDGLHVAPQCVEKYAYIKRLCTDLPGSRPCRLCIEDPTTSEADRAKIWTNYRLTVQHLVHEDDDPPTANAFHSPATKLTRWLVQRGMDRAAARREKTAVRCTLIRDHSGKRCKQEIIAVDGNESLFKHVYSFHLESLPDDLSHWLSTYVSFVKDRHAQQAKALAARGGSTSRAEILSHQSPYSAPVPFELVATSAGLKTEKRHWDSTEILRALYSRNYQHPALEDPSLPMIPTVDTAQNDIEKALATRLQELKQYIPLGLYREDGYTLAISLDPITNLLENAPTDVLEGLAKSAEDILAAHMSKLEV